jgi:alkylhydroperoxidase family enzyme
MPPRMRTLGIEEADASIRPDLEAFEKARGKVPNLFATLARRPGTMRAAAGLLREVTAPGEVSVRVKEMVAVRVSRANACEY